MDAGAEKAMANNFGMRPGSEPPERAGARLQRGAEYTGRYVVLLDRADPVRGMNALRSAAGVAAVERVRGAEPESAVAMLARPNASVLFDELAVAVVDAQPDQRHALVTTAEAEPTIIAAEPERVVYATVITEARQAVTGFFPAYRSDERELQRFTQAQMAAQMGPAWDETTTTWGIQAIRANLSGQTGRGVKVAVLDTGVDTDHPDLTGCLEETASFVEGQSVEDGKGHGTHCIGTVAGPARPAQGPRYGVADEARVLAGKVLNNAGIGADGQILAGIAWAVSHGARVISMSFGSPVARGELFSQTYEEVAQRALDAGVLMVAAAGNESQRPGDVEAVDSPANCPSILAVAAVDRALATAWFSCGALNGQGGEINIAGPGVDVLSAVPNGGLGLKSGTSMATPHVAGALALIAQAHPEASATDLRSLLLSGASPLSQGADEVGVGLLQVP